MSSYRPQILVILCALCFFARTAGAQSNLHWHTSSTTSYQAGDGNWSTSGLATSQRWSSSPTDTPFAWINGSIASFDTSGTSPITPANLSDMTVSAMVFNGTGYTIANAGVETTVKLYLSGAATITTNAGATISASLGGAAGVGMTKEGSATLILGGRNTWIGATTVNAGTLVLDNNNQTVARLLNTIAVNVNAGGTLLLNQSGATASIDRINNSAGVNMVGGSIFNTGGLTEGTAPSGPLTFDGAAGMGILTLSSTTAPSHIRIDFATLPKDAGSALIFSALSGAAGQYVDILNWTGTAGSDDGNANNDRLLFASDPLLTPTDLANFNFYSDSGSTLVGAGATELPYGNMIELVPVPAAAPAPTPTPCEVDSFGSILGPNGGNASFSSVVRHTQKGKTIGNFHYDDPASGLSFDGFRISGLTFIPPNHARFNGTAKLSKKKQYSFTVDAYDNGLNGAGDQFFITISNGYSAGGPLTSGDIDIGSCTE